jgi:hypothetical protein
LKLAFTSRTGGSATRFVSRALQLHLQQALLLHGGNQAGPFPKAPGKSGDKVQYVVVGH